MAASRYRHLNASVIKQISKSLEYDSAADIESVLNKVYTSYASLRRRIGERHAQRQAELENSKEKSPLKQPLRDALFYIASAILWQPNPLSEEWPLPPPKFLSCSLPCSVVFPLSPVVCNILGIMDDSVLDLSTIVVGRVLSGIPIWEGPSRGVFQVGENVVVKISQDLGQDEHEVLQFMENVVQTFPSPAPWD